MGCENESLKISCEHKMQFKKKIFDGQAKMDMLSERKMLYQKQHTFFFPL